MERPQTPAKNPARSLKKWSLQQLSAKTAEADIIVISNGKCLKKIRIDIVRRVVRDTSSNYWHIMKKHTFLAPSKCAWEVEGENMKQTTPINNSMQSFVLILLLVLMSTTSHCKQEEPLL